MFLPSKFVQAPELLIPGQKPCGRVEVDWSHPLARGLAFASIGDVDLVSNCPATVRAEKTVTRHGTAISQGSVETYSVGRALPIDAGSEITLFLAGVGSGGNFYAGQNIFGTGLGLTPNCGFYSAAGRQIYAQMRRTTNPYPIAALVSDFDTNGVDDGDFFTCAAKNRAPTDTMTVYFNGIQTRTSNALWGGVYDDISDRVQFGEPHNGVHQLAGYIWNRALSAQEIQSLHANPYQFLKPAGSAW